MNKVHFMTGDKCHNGSESTWCGKVGWEDRGVAYEYTTADNWRFEGTDVRKKVTCKRCLKATAHGPHATVSSQIGRDGT